MSNFRSVKLALVSLVVLSVSISVAHADFWANDGLGPGGNVLKKYNTDGTYANLSIETGMFDVRKLGYYDGYVYAVDTGGGTVKRWNSTNGSPDSTWSISAVNPLGIGFDSFGKLYLCIYGNSNGQGDGLTQVARYNRETGTPDGWVASGYTIYQPGDVAFDAAGKVYVADSNRSIIERFNADGTFEKIFAQGNGLLGNTVSCMTFDSIGRLYTGCWGSASIQRWAVDGTFEGALAGYTNYQGQMAFQGDQLMVKYSAYGTFGCVPGASVDGVISGTWLGTGDSKEDWGWTRQGLAVIPATPTNGWINLKVVFQDFTGDKTLVPVKIEVYKGGVSTGDARTVFLSNDSYVLTNLVPGSDYTVAVSAAKWLRTVVPVSVTAGQGATCVVTLKNGDLDGDNQVTSTDMSILLRNIDVVGD